MEILFFSGLPCARSAGAATAAAASAAKRRRLSDSLDIRASLIFFCFTPA
jgi:hypothetical protein